jgi:hypothetical protein
MLLGEREDLFLLWWDCRFFYDQWGSRHKRLRSTGVEDARISE